MLRVEALHVRLLRGLHMGKRGRVVCLRGALARSGSVDRAVFFGGGPLLGIAALDGKIAEGHVRLREGLRARL